MPSIEKTKIEALTLAVNSTETDKTKKIEAINTKIADLI
jgi:hypothetical protein